MPPSFCAGQQRVANSTIGCMLLSHDEPVASRSNYNTTDDVLSLIANAQYAPWFKGSETIYIALCFKYSENPCDGSVNSNNWLLLADTLFSQANQLISSLGLNLQLIVDGAGSPTGRSCLDNRFSPWNSTWIVFSDPLAALTSNSPTDGYVRYQVNNMPQGAITAQSNLQFLQKLQFGKFLNSGNPFLFWEPSDQPTITTVASTYLTGPINDYGFRFAINIDPIQFKVYSGSVTGDAVNIPLNINAAHSFISGMTSVVYNGTCNLLVQLALNSSIPPPACLQIPNEQIQSWTSTRVGSENFYFAYYLDGRVAVVSSFKAASVVITLPVNVKESVIQGALAATTLNNSLVLIQVQVSSSGVLYTQAYTLEPRDPFVATALGAGGADSVGAISVAVSAAGGDFVTLYDMGSRTLSKLGTISPSNGAQYTFDGPSSIGNQPAVSLLTVDNATYVLSLSGNDFCFNTEVQNKQPSPALCDVSPISTPYVLAYTFGRIEDWLTYQNELSTSCDATLLHGMYDMGSNPSAGLVFQDGVLYGLSTHEGLPQNATDIGGCGIAIVQEGVVFDAFSLPLL